MKVFTADATTASTGTTASSRNGVVEGCGISSSSNATASRRVHFHANSRNSRTSSSSSSSRSSNKRVASSSFVGRDFDIDDNDDFDNTDTTSLAYRQMQARKTCLIRRRAAFTLITIYCLVGVYFGMRHVSSVQNISWQDIVWNSTNNGDGGYGLEPVVTKAAAVTTATTTTLTTKPRTESSETSSNYSNKNTKDNINSNQQNSGNKTETEDDDPEDYLSWHAIQEWGRHHARVWSPLAAAAATASSSSSTSRFAWCTRDPYGRDRSMNSTFMFHNPTGLIYVKMPKAASSTLAGMVHRVALRVGQRQVMLSNSSLSSSSSSIIKGKRGSSSSSSSLACAFRNQHIKQAWRWYGNRNRSASILMSSIRHPASRALSRVFFEMSFRKWNTPQSLQGKNNKRSSPNHAAATAAVESKIFHLLHTMQNIQYGAISKGQGGFQLQYTSLTPIPFHSAWDASDPNHVICPRCVQQMVQQVLQDYDLWMITERMEESVVALQQLLHVDMGDVVVFSTNQGGKYYYQPVLQKQQQRNNNNNYTDTSTRPSPHCLPLKKSFTTRNIQEYFQSRVWRAQNYGDYLLYAAVQASLNATIQHGIGTSTFQQARHEYHDLVQRVTKACRNDTIFPCSDRGHDQSERSRSNCYHQDEGCGYPCIDQFLRTK